MIRRYRKTATVEAIQYTGDNREEIEAFVGKTHSPEMSVAKHLAIHTLEGTLRAEPGDWILKGVRGECWPCKPDIFNDTYTPE